MKHPWSFYKFKLPVHPNFSISKGNGGKRRARSASKWEVSESPVAAGISGSQKLVLIES
jgi:hypothetical protein